MTEFGEQVRRLKAERGISLRRLAKIVHYDAGYLSKVVNGHKPPSSTLAARLDDALGAGGTLVASDSERRLGPPQHHALAGQTAAPGPAALRASSGSASCRTDEPSPGDLGAARGLIMATADESARFGRRAAQTNVHPVTLEQLDQDVDRLAWAYLTEPLVSLVCGMRQLRGAAFELLEGRQHPNQARHLYLIAGRACGMLAGASSDLGYYYAAETHARTGWLCAELSDDNGLRAWILGCLSTIAFWDGRWPEAVQRARAGRNYASGLDKVRLASLEARASARLGDSAGAVAAVASAVAAREEAGNEGAAGLFDFTAANQIRCAGCAYLWLGEAEQARHALERALELFEDAESGPGAVSYAHVAVTRVDLATSLLHLGLVDAARDIMGPVLALPPMRRLSGVARRAGELRSLLRGPAFRGVAAARELDEQLEAFGTASDATQLSGAGAAR